SNPPVLPPPERACCPFEPLVEVLPCPDPGPRPTFLRRRLAPGAGRRSSSLMGHLEHVGHLRHHAANRRRVLVRHRVVHAPESEGLDGGFLLGTQSDHALGQGDLKRRGHWWPPATRRHRWCAGGPPASPEAA